ncbi:MAG: sigma-70 family RNA polymerase sigma factor [Gemmatimonadota bacterium]
MDWERKRREFETEALPHLDTLWEVALRLAQGDEPRAQDFLQEALLQAFRSWHTFRPGTNCRAWLTAILRNTMVNHYRASRRHAAHLEFSEISERVVFREMHTVDPQGRFFDHVVDHEVIQAVDRLPLAYREVLILSDLEGLSYAEIVEILGIPTGTVKSRLFRARKSLQVELYDYAMEAGYVNGDPNGNGHSSPAGVGGAIHPEGDRTNGHRGANGSGLRPPSRQRRTGGTPARSLAPRPEICPA